MSALLRGPEAVHDADCLRFCLPPAAAKEYNCTCGAVLQQRILDEFWNSDLPSVRRVKRLCAMVDMLPGKENIK